MTLAAADYVIAGGGSAGCVLAARLSEDPKCRVVLLEAGGAGDGFMVTMPSGSYTLLGKPAADWIAWNEIGDAAHGDPDDRIEYGECGSEEKPELRIVELEVSLD